MGVSISMSYGDRKCKRVLLLIFVTVIPAAERLFQLSRGDCVHRTKFFELDLKPVCKFCYDKFPTELKKRLKKAYDLQSKK